METINLRLGLVMCYIILTYLQQTVLQAQVRPQATMKSYHVD